MKITDIKLYLLKSGTAGESGAKDGESQYCGGGWASNSLIANPMSFYPKYAPLRTMWFGAGQDPYAIEIHTDEGVMGVCANYGGGPFACAVIEKHLKRFLIGESPFNIEKLWDQMHRATSPYGLGGIGGMAIAGVDLALYDLVGKITGQPVYNLIGGKTRDEIPCYVTIHPDAIDAWVGSGFLGVKIAAPWGEAEGLAGLHKMEACIKKCRETIGWDMDLMIDCYLSWSPEFAIRLADMVKEYRVRWFEDPLPNGWEWRTNKDLRSKIQPIMVATGNLEFHYKAFHEIIINEATDIIQPEIQWVGGMTSALKIAAMAKPYGMPVIPHSSGVYNYHFVTANSNSPFAEYLAVGEPTGTKLVPTFEAVIGEPVPVNGKITLSDAPGFGVELNYDKLRPYSG